MKRDLIWELLLIVSILVIFLTSFFLCFIASAASKDTWIDPSYVKICEEVGSRKNISPEFLEAFIEAESSGVPTASNGNCKGLMQVYESVHRGRMQKLGVTNLYDPKGNIEVGSDILIELFETYGDDLSCVVMMYNGSRDAKERAANWNFTDYANKVLNRAAELERLHGK